MDYKYLDTLEAEMDYWERARRTEMEIPVGLIDKMLTTTLMFMDMQINRLIKKQRELYGDDKEGV